MSNKEEYIIAKFSQGLGEFDQHYGYPQIENQEIYKGVTGKVVDIQGIQAHAGQNFFVPEGKKFSLDINQYPYLHIAIKAEPGTSTCLFLLVHEKKQDWNRRFVAIGETPQGDCRYHLMSNYFTIEDDSEWHEYVYDLRRIREEEDNNVYHQPLCPDAGSIREIQFYAWTGTGKHTFHFNDLICSDKEHPSGQVLIKSITVTPELAKAGDQIKVTFVGDPGGRSRFSIAKVFDATDLPMTEKPEEPGTYSGVYTAQVGDNVENAALMIVFTTRGGETICRKADQRVTIDTIPPRITGAEVTPEVISNGQTLRLRAISKPGCRMIADISELDTTQLTVSLTEEREISGTYQTESKISTDNKASNGTKNIRIIATDVAGNESEPAVVTVELRNSELQAIRELTGDVAGQLNRAGVVTMTDLRHIDVDKVAHETGLSSQELERYQGAAKLQAIGIDADVTYALVHLGNIRNPTQLVLTPREKIDQIVQAGVHEGIIHRERAIDVNLSNQVFAAGIWATMNLMESYQDDVKQAVDTCQAECPDELSAFGSHAYLLELVEITGMKWDELEDKFKQDFLAVTNGPARRIDIAILALERAINQDLGNPPRLHYHWEDYDLALNRSLVRIMVESTGKSEAVLAKEHPNAFDSNRFLVDRNNDLENLLLGLEWNNDYNDALISLLKERTGKSEADLATQYPKAFDLAYTLQDRNKELEKILGLSRPGERIDEAKAALESLELEALVIQSGMTASQLRNKYYISFSTAQCAETTTCRQAILTLQEYLAEKGYEYPTYDEWRLEQVKKFYPENIYTHELKRSLIVGDRQLLRQHLEQARKILDEVRVSVDRKEPQEDDLLKSFRWRNPYYTNLKAGLDLIQECWEVDDLMVKGHEAFFNEEHQQARQYYLEAAEKIRLTSKKISKPMGDALLPLWAPDGKDCYLNKHPRGVWQAAADYLTATVLSYAPENKSGVELARGQVVLNGVDYEGKFWPMYHFFELSKNYWKYWENRLSAYGWINQNSYWELVHIASHDRCILRDLGVNPSSPSSKIATLFYSKGEWTDIKIELETYEYLRGGVIFRHALKDLSLGDYSSGLVGILEGTKQVISTVGTSLTDYTKISERDFSVSGKNKYRMTVELRGNDVKAAFYSLNQNGKWDPMGILGPTYLTNLRKSGGIGFYCSIYAPNENFPQYSCEQVAFSKISVWDLSPATGAFSDLAFFLPPEPSIDCRYPVDSLNKAYMGRQWEPLETLPTKISMNYYENDWIIEPHVVGKEPFDPLGPKRWEANYGLWYGQGDDRLDRENAGQLLDGFPMLFCHQYFFLLPVCLGDVANALGQFDEALQWYHMAYDEREPWAHRKVYYYLSDVVEWEMMRLRIAQNYVEWADFLFNQNTEEGVHEARMRYGQALRTLETEDCCEQEQQLNMMMQDMVRDMLSRKTSNANAASQIYRTVAELANKLGKHDQLQGLIKGIQQVAISDENAEAKAAQITDLLAEQVPVIKSQPPLSTIVGREKTLPERLVEIERRHPEVLDDIEANIRTYETLTRHLGARQVANPQLVSDAPAPMAETLPSNPQPAESAQSSSAVMTTNSILSVPYRVYKDPSLREMYEKIGPLVGLPDNLVPEHPSGPVPVDPSLAKKALPAWVKNELCVPQNLVLDALTRRACLGIYYIDYCFNSLGFPQDDLSTYRFEYLVSMAKNFAQMALAAEKDFIQFKEQFEKDTFELMNASQAVAISQAAVQLALFKINEALGQVATANIGIERVNAQITLTQQRIDELGSDLAIFGIVLGAVAAAVGSFFTAGAAGVAYGAAVAAGAGAATAGAANYMSGIEENEENLRMQLQLLKTVEYNAAWQNRRNAIDAERSASWQAHITELEAKFAAEKAKFLATEFFNPQLWSFLAREVKKNYRTYMTYGTIAAWLAQRAFEFERGVKPRRRFAASGPDESGSGLNIIRFDYFQPSLQGLLGADSLLRDIATLENEKFLNEERKKWITKVISLASTRPFIFAKFLETGVLPFATTLDEFDHDYPGHYQRRIRNVRINLFALVGQEGIKATLTCSGTSQVVVKEFVEENGQITPEFVEKALRRPQESIALTNPQGGGIGQIPLVPKEEMLTPFEGQGVATQWIFEMPKHANKIDYNTITDIQILIDYTALDDSFYRDEVLKRLPRRRGALRTFSFRLEFPDALFHLKDSPLPLNMTQTNDTFTGLYTIVLDTRAEDFPPNELNRKLTDAVLYIRSKGQDFSTLKIKLASRSWLIGQNSNWQEADLTQNSFVDMETPPPNSPDSLMLKPHYIGRRKSAQSGITESVTDRWYFFISPDDNPDFLKKDGNTPVLVNGNKVFDFSEIEDVIFGLNYNYDAPLPKL
jgi:hypothetical protein